MRKLDKNFPRVPCTQKDLDFLEQKSKSGGISKAQFLRNSVYFTEVVAIDKNHQKRQLYLLSNLTNNINQIAKFCNTKKRIDLSIIQKLDEILEFAKGVRDDY